MILVHKMVKDTCKQSICMCILEVYIYAERVGERCYSEDFSKLNYIIKIRWKLLWVDTLGTWKRGT